MPTPRRTYDDHDRMEDDPVYRFAREVLVEQRLKLGLIEDDIAAAVGTSQRTINRVEHGKRLDTYEEVEVYAKAYRLSARQKAAWRAILFGTPDMPLQQIEQLLINVQQALGVTTKSDHYDYFATQHSYDRFVKVDYTWDDLYEGIQQLMQAPSLPIRNVLLSECGATLMHYLDGRSRLQQRLALANVAAKAAEDLERYTIAGWLYCDGVPWVYIEEHPDEVYLARNSLNKGLQIAARIGNNDMQALALAFFARTYLTDARADAKQADEYISRALALPVTQRLRVRVYLVQGDVFSHRKDYEKAQEWYTKAWELGKQVTPSIHPLRAQLGIVNAHVESGKYLEAKRSLEALIADTQSLPQSPHRQAKALYLLATINNRLGNIAEMRANATEAYALLHQEKTFPMMLQKLRSLIGR